MQINNKAVLIGTVRDIRFNNKRRGNVYYKAELVVTRLSGKDDVIKILYNASECDELIPGMCIRVDGIVRSEKLEKHNNCYIFCESVEIQDADYFQNDVMLQGFVCREPNIKQTKNGYDLCDFSIAINRGTGKQDYVPIVTWAVLARKIYREIGVGTEVNVWGRFQSRGYTKKFADGHTEEHVVRELSVTSYRIVESEE